MKKRHLALCLVALVGAPAAALAGDKQAADKQAADPKAGKHRDGLPGRPGLPGRDGMPAHADMHDGGTPGMHEQGRDGGAPRRPGYKNAMRELYQDLKDGKLKKDELKGRLAQLQETLGERSKEHRQDIAKRWGATLARPPARNELEIHARRMAFLDRALVLSQGDSKPNKDQTIDRISKLIDKENARHDRAMARIQSQPTTATSTASAIPATSAAPGGNQ